jgi:hypothetical protein
MEDCNHQKPFAGVPVPSTGTNGEAIYDQKFFLALARCGTDVWNKWRMDNTAEDPVVYIRATFADVDFREDQSSAIDFSRFNFGHSANFSGCHFGDGPELADNARFVQGMAMFAGAIFGDEANFSGAIFGDRSNFCDSVFADEADFSGAIFGAHASFSDSTFGFGAHFVCSTFGSGANFSGSTFGTISDFSCASFGSYSSFSGSTFDAMADFSGASFGVWPYFEDATFRGSRSEFRGLSQADWTAKRAKLLERPSLQNWTGDQKEKFLRWPDDIPNRPDCFSQIGFIRTKFQCYVDFSGRKTVEHVFFTRA